MLQAKDGGPKVRGRIGAWTKDAASGLVLPLFTKTNQIQISWGFVAAKQLGFRRGRGLDYSIAGMYLEYENVADPDDVVDIPTDFDRSEGLDYYNDLAGSGIRDFLRVALLQEPLISIADGYEAYFGEGEGNQLTFLAMTSGSEGIHGTPFSAGENSKICGCALVATPVLADRTQDVVVARTYFAEEDQVVKELPKQVGVTWELVFE